MSYKMIVARPKRRNEPVIWPNPAVLQRASKIKPVPPESWSKTNFS